VGEQSSGRPNWFSSNQRILITSAIRTSLTLNRPDVAPTEQVARFAEDRAVNEELAQEATVHKDNHDDELKAIKSSPPIAIMGKTN
jgi:hypothetical protein